MKEQVRGLIDTGALLALLDADDNWHERCVEAFSSLKLPLATTAAVLAELFHLLGEHPNNLNAAWKLLRSGAICVLPITDADSAGTFLLLPVTVGSNLPLASLQRRSRKIVYFTAFQQMPDAARCADL